jgi:hypothetical protein
VFSSNTSIETKSKSKYRNPRQTSKQINLKSGTSKTSNPKQADLEILHNDFGFDHLILFRISDFVLRNFAVLTMLRYPTVKLSNRQHEDNHDPADYAPRHKPVVAVARQRLS